MEKLLSWCAVVGLCTLAGNGLGLLMDSLLFEISYDYVYPPDYVRAAGNRWGCWLGTCIAAVSVIGSQPLPTMKWNLGAASSAVCFTAVAAVAFAIIGWCAVKFGFSIGDGSTLSRSVFCMELVRGCFAGGLTATGLWIVAVWRLRANALRALMSPPMTVRPS